MTKRRAALAATIVYLLIVTLGAALNFETLAAQRERVRSSVADLGSAQARAIERQLARSTLATVTLQSMLELNESQTIADFDRIAASLMQHYGGLRSRRLTLTGPFPLTQGGDGVVARLPVFRPAGSDQFWGFVIALIRLPTLLRASDLDRVVAEGYAYELSRARPGRERHVFARSMSDPLEGPVQFPIKVPGGTWTLSMAPAGGWGDPVMPLFRALLGLVVAGGLAVALYRLLRQPELLRREVEERTQLLQRSVVESWLQKRELSYANERTQAILTSSPDAIATTDADGVITEWNPAAERLFGWTRDEVVGAHVSIILPPNVKPAAEDESAERTGDGVRQVVGPRLRKDGTIFQAEITLSQVEDATMGALTNVMVVRDVTVDRMVRDACAAIRSTLDPVQAMRSFGDVVGPAVRFGAIEITSVEGRSARRLVCLDPLGSVLAGKERVRMEGTALGEAVATGVPVLVDPDPADSSFAVPVDALLVVPLTIRGQVFAALSMGFPAQDTPTQKTVDLVTGLAAAVSQDVANMLLYEREREAAARLRELDELKSDFLSTVSHELRTPLTAIAGFAATLDDHWTRASEQLRRDFVRRIVTQATELDHLIAQLLDFARLERGHVRLDLRPCDLRTEIGRELSKLDDKLAMHTVELDVPDGLHVEADPHGLERIVENLLTNAAKFSPTGTVITIRAVGGDEEATVLVTDEGPGVPPPERDRIFERFYRIDRGDRHDAGGTGIGLAIVRQFVEAHGGRVWVDSAPGPGTTFAFTLRRAGFPQRAETGIELGSRAS